MDRHLAVIANAGSGKTTVLVNRYVKLIMNGVRPRDIAAITFTRKAAAEMLTRIVNHIEDIKSKATQSEDLKKLRIIREQLSSARIMTIHSFCSSILRDYPVESGIQPNYSELNEADKTRIINDAINSVLEEWLSNDESVKRFKAVRLFDTFNKNKIESLIKLILKKREIQDFLHKLYNENSYDELILKVHATLDELFQSRILNTLNILKKIVNNIDSTVLTPAAKSNYIIGKSILEKLFGNSTILSIEQDSKKLSELLKDIEQIIEIFYTDKNTVKVNIAKGIFSEQELEKANAIGSHFELLENISEPLLNKSRDNELIELVAILFEITNDVLALMDEEKQILGAIDFDDMLLKTYDILQSDEIRNKVLRDIKYLMIDEFQDTNPLQYRIISRLVPAFDKTHNEYIVNLFIVGDAKQSIYGFRDADVRLFKKAAVEIKNVNKLELGKGKINHTFKTETGIISGSQDEIEGQIKLDVSFRMVPILAAFINKVCGKLFSKDSSEFDAEYDDLACVNENTADSGITKLNDRCSESIAFLLFPKPKRKVSKSDESSDESNQADGVASYIKQFVATGRNTKKRDKIGSDIINYSDVAVLIRSRNGVKELISAFQKQDVPYVLHSGKGFFEAQEIIDIISFLKFLHNQQDNLSLAAILRSAFFSLSDSDLFIISKDGKSGSLWEKFTRHITKINSNGFIDRPDTYLKLRAYNMLNELIKYSGRISISFLINKILDDSGWYGLIASEPARHQMEANVEKLIYYARDFENRGFKNLYDYVVEMELLLQESPESEAAFLTGQDAVNIMTIHSAKGLEFPVVILYNAGKSSGGYKSEIINDSFGLTFPLPVYNESLSANENITTPLHYINKIKSYDAAIAEEKRILYVALTRASNHLVLSSVEDFKDDSIMGMTVSSLGIDRNIYLKSSDNKISDNRVFVFEQSLNYYNSGDDAVTKKLQSVRINIIHSYQSGSVNIEKVQAESESPLILMGELKSEITDELVSSTKLLMYDRDFDSYINRYKLGLPNTNDFEHLDTDLNNEVKDSDGALTGTLLHSVMESICHWFTNDAKIEESKLKEILLKVVRAAEITLNEAQFDYIYEQCFQAASTPLLRKYALYIKDAMLEYSLYLPVGEDILIGKIDLLLKNSESDIEIWDWKTNKIRSKNDIEELARHYEFQMKVYAYLISRRLPEMKNVSTRLLFTQLASSGCKDDDWTYQFTWLKSELFEFGNELILRVRNMKEKTYFSS